MRLNLPHGIAYIGFAMLDDTGKQPIPTLQKVDDGWMFALDVQASPPGTMPAQDKLTYSRGHYAGAWRDHRFVAEGDVDSGLCFPSAVRALAFTVSASGEVQQATLTIQDSCRQTADGPVYRLNIYVGDPTNRPDDFLVKQINRAIDMMEPLGFRRQVSAPC